MSMKNEIDVISFCRKTVIGGQYIRFTHGSKPVTGYVRCMDFCDSIKKFLEENEKMDDSRFYPKVTVVKPYWRKCVDGNVRCVFDIEMSVRNTMVCHCANSIETDNDPYRPYTAED